MKQAKYEKYKSTHQREKNKIKKILRHLKKHVNDLKSFDKINELKAKFGL